MTLDMSGKQNEKEARLNQGLWLGAGMGLPEKTLALEDGVGLVHPSLTISARGIWWGWAGERRDISGCGLSRQQLCHAQRT